MHKESANLLEVQTLGSKGLKYRHHLGRGVSEWLHLDAVHAPRLSDTCGAGDWCTAGLIAKGAAYGQAGLRQLGADGIRDALRYGQALAAWNCGFEGARGGMYVTNRETFNDHIDGLLHGRSPDLSVKAKAPVGASVACPACPPELPPARRSGPSTAHRVRKRANAA